jgi:hypothetical protein
LGLGANPSLITTWVLKGSKEKKMFMSQFKGGISTIKG